MSPHEYDGESKLTQTELRPNVNSTGIKISTIVTAELFQVVLTVDIRG